MMNTTEPDFLKDLNEAQHDAVIYKDGPQLVIAEQALEKPECRHIRLPICSRRATSHGK